MTVVTDDWVWKFAEALKIKLRKADNKYGHEDSWMDDDWEEKCRKDMQAHIDKGDPLDVAAYCMFMWYHSWTTNENDND